MRARRRSPTKGQRILAVLIGGRSLTRFDSEELGDHCLPSTVATLQRQGARIQRERIKIDGRFGCFHCCRYWIDDADRDRARLLLEGGSP